jgi:hypothetical protein
MDNQQGSPEQGNLQRLFRKEVGTSVPKWRASYEKDDDIVCAVMKVAGVVKTTGQV